MADAIAIQPSIDPEEMLLMRIKGVVAQIKRREMQHKGGEGTGRKNALAAEDLYGRIDELKRQLGSKFSAEADRIVSGLYGITPMSSPCSPPTRPLSGS